MSAMSVKDFNAALKQWAEQPKTKAALDRALYGLGGRDWPAERIAAQDGNRGRVVFLRATEPKP